MHSKYVFHRLSRCIVQHKSTQGLYRVEHTNVIMATAHSYSIDGEPMVVYSSMDPTPSDTGVAPFQVFVRPQNEFFETVTTGDGSTHRRFQVLRLLE